MITIIIIIIIISVWGTWLIGTIFTEETDPVFLRQDLIARELCVDVDVAAAASADGKEVSAEAAEEIRRAGVKQKVLEHVRYAGVPKTAESVPNKKA